MLINQKPRMCYTRDGVAGQLRLPASPAFPHKYVVYTDVGQPEVYRYAIFLPSAPPCLPCNTAQEDKWRTARSPFRPTWRIYATIAPQRHRPFAVVALAPGHLTISNLPRDDRSTGVCYTKAPQLSHVVPASVMAEKKKGNSLLYSPRIFHVRCPDLAHLPMGPPQQKPLEGDRGRLLGFMTSAFLLLCV
ncbi:hypothetical protein BD779DRAFT_974434 [Infundibulicybe gibba]|nr:hypothetical protein BD779DRAFT_974434 [Infundibulicybe gibba]